MKKKISLKAKVTLTAIILFIVSFAAMSFVSLHFMEDLISEHMIAQFINEDTQLAKQVSILLEKGADTQELQSFVEDCVAQNEHYAYAVAIDTTVTAVAHSDVEKIGKSYLDDTAYTVPASQNGDVMTSQFWADVQKAWTYDVMCPIYVNGSLNVFNHRSNIQMDKHRVLCFQLKSLGKALKEIGLLIMQDAVWNRVTANRSKHKTTWFYIDEFHLLLKGQTGSFSVEIWKRFRKWGGIPSGLTQNVKDLLASREIENIFENSDFIYMLNQAQGDRQILAKQLGISPHQLSYVTHSGPGEGLLFFGNVIIPFVDHFPKDTLLYSVLTTRPDEVAGTKA